MDKSMNIREQAERVLEEAKNRGLESNFFFVTTFKRYQVQMSVMNELEKAIKEDGMLIKKVYVKGRENICINPAITEYNKTATAANGTVSTLINIVRSFPSEEINGSKLQELADRLNCE